MFTGIVETVGEVTQMASEGDVTRLTVAAAPITEGVGLGDSVAVNGACLTVTAFDESSLAFDAISETMQKTALGDLGVGSSVNLERAMRADGRLDGHIVQGHVDGTGTVREWVRNGADVRLYVDCGPEITNFLVDKGSVAIDGVSLTVVEARDDGFDVALIPHTLDVTTLGDRKPGHRVNLEADVLGKYVRRYLDRIHAG